jgi:hypothetical protein
VFLALREEHSLRTFENKVLRKHLNPEGESDEDGENRTVRSFVNVRGRSPFM